MKLERLEWVHLEPIEFLRELVRGRDPSIVINAQCTGLQGCWLALRVRRWVPTTRCRPPSSSCSIVWFLLSWLLFSGHRQLLLIVLGFLLRVLVGRSCSCWAGIRLASLLLLLLLKLEDLLQHRDVDLGRRSRRLLSLFDRQLLLGEVLLDRPKKLLHVDSGKRTR